MAFMMPVVRNNYEIYPAKTKSRKGGNSGNNSARSSRPGSRTVSESEKSNVDSRHFLTISPSRHASLIYSTSAPAPSHLRPQQRTVRFCRSVSQDSQVARRRSTISGASSSSAPSSSCSNNTSTTGSTSNVETTSPKFGSLSKFHSKLLDSLKRKLRIKDDEVCDDDVTAVIRSST